jgi:hypothetical protein
METVKKCCLTPKSASRARTRIAQGGETMETVKKCCLTPKMPKTRMVDKTPKSMTMKTKIHLILITLISMSSIHAGEPEVAEIVDMARKERDNLLMPFDGFNRSSSGIEFERLMNTLGEKVSRRDEAAIERLDPQKLEDRIELIALDFVRRSEAYTEIYDKYVRHPTEEEFQRMKEEYQRKHEEFLNRFREQGVALPQARPLGDGVALKDPTFPAPIAVDEEHLNEEHRYCLEYFWMAPQKGKTMKNHRGTLARALDQLKEENGDQPDIRDLLE